MRRAGSSVPARLVRQPDEAGHLAVQQAFAAAHPWFHVRKLSARRCFPMFEVPQDMAAAIGEFLT